MPDRLPTPPSAPRRDPSEDGSRPSADPDTESTGAEFPGNPGTADNPFAPPPEGAPDRPWQPRQQGDGDKRGDRDGGSRWSSRQPGRSSGPFGQRPGEGEGQGGGPGGPGGLRWDPTDPVQRRARYALLAGMWGFFFALFSWTYLGLLLGALALYWGISSLRAKAGAEPGGTAKADVDAITGRAPREPAEPQAAGRPQGQQGPGQPGARPQKTAAVTGIVVGALALAVVAATFTVQTVYREYYTCVNDALTTTAAKNCGDLLPKEIRPLLETTATAEEG
ncbi:hypothetical protein [Streptomyces cavernicola]|uniref:Integral membrane protein n=1 Tax=Streptomyces cavernicola TaxID=3043613 RepID=A0ABT6SBZ8_9ACTN|nr:hypothetical protein [Streptomyces sp. B-S-A6]MDI3405480.1 hypothetical protein [Streptomyces sp. B-S-A6]